MVNLIIKSKRDREHKAELGGNQTRKRMFRKGGCDPLCWMLTKCRWDKNWNVLFVTIHWSVYFKIHGVPWPYLTVKQISSCGCSKHKRERKRISLILQIFIAQVYQMFPNIHVLLLLGAVERLLGWNQSLQLLLWHGLTQGLKPNVAKTTDYPTQYSFSLLYQIKRTPIFS